MNKTNSKIAQRSREKIVDALLRVMRQYDYREITITQIAQEAGLARKTFYRLFAGKEDVLACLFERLYMECFAGIRARNTTHYWDIVQCYFDFWEERRPLLELFRQNCLLPLLFDGAYRYSFCLFEYIRSAEVAGQFSGQLPYLLAYSVGGMHSMLQKWVENDMSIPSAQLIGQLKEGFRSDEL